MFLQKFVLKDLCYGNIYLSFSGLTQCVYSLSIFTYFKSVISDFIVINFHQNFEYIMQNKCFIRYKKSPSTFFSELHINLLVSPQILTRFNSEVSHIENISIGQFQINHSVYIPYSTFIEPYFHLEFYRKPKIHRLIPNPKHYGFHRNIYCSPMNFTK